MTNSLIDEMSLVEFAKKINSDAKAYNDLCTDMSSWQRVLVDILMVLESPPASLIGRQLNAEISLATLSSGFTGIRLGLSKLISAMEAQDE